MPVAEPTEGEFAPLLDVSELPLADLMSIDAPAALRRSAARLARDLADPDGVIAAFTSYAGE